MTPFQFFCQVVSVKNQLLIFGEMQTVKDDNKKQALDSWSFTLGLRWHSTYSFPLGLLIKNGTVRV
jgi:hypothetical protein